MKTDREIIAIYRIFKNEMLPKLNVTYECEKVALAKKTCLTRRKSTVR